MTDPAIVAYPLIPTKAYVKTFDTGEVVQCGSFTVPNATDLLTIRVLLFTHGPKGGTEQLRGKIYTDSGYTKLLATGAWSNLSDISNPGTDWWGWFSLNFSNVPMDTTTCYLAVETQNYTRGAADASYLGISLDWPVPQNTNSSAPRYALAMQVYGYRSP